MSRYPFMEYANRYIDSMRGVYSPSTIPGMERRYRRIERDLIHLKNKNRISTMSPAKFTYEDIRSLITYRLSEGVPSSDVARDITALRVLCQFTENAAVAACLRRYPQYKRLKYSAKQRLPTLADADITHIWDTLGPVEDADYRRLRAYTLVLLSYYCGMRTKELRGLETSDVDLTNKLILIRHPKGEMTYGQQRTVPIHHDIVPLLRRWMGTIADGPLYPSKSSADGRLSTNTLRACKGLVEKETGKHFDFRKCRRSFGQSFIDNGLDIESVSVLMGHDSTRTTEKYYSRKRNDAAMAAAKTVWKTSEKSLKKGKTVPKTGFEPVNSYENRS